MRIILKIIAAPAVLALTLIVAVLNFSVSLASWVLGILSASCPLSLRCAACSSCSFRAIHNGGSPGWCLLFCFPLLDCPPQPSGWSASWMILPTR